VVTSLQDLVEPEEVTEWEQAFDIQAGTVGWDEVDNVWDTFHDGPGRPQFVVLDRDFMVVDVTHDEAQAEAAALDAL